MKKAQIILQTVLFAGLALNVHAADNSQGPGPNGKKCTMAPVFTSAQIGPQEIRAMSDQDVEVKLAGNISIAENCQVTAGYTLESSTGILQGSIALGPDGSFSKKFMADLSEKGQDKYGGVYNGTLFAIDSDGDTATIEYSITVLPESDNMLGWNK